jgi:hypothetical protein
MGQYALQSVPKREAFDIGRLGGWHWTYAEDTAASNTRGTMEKQPVSFEEPFVDVRNGRSMAFVHGDDTLVKTACLYYPHVITSRTSVSTESRETIRALNSDGVRFVEVSEGEEILHFTQSVNDWRNPDQLPEEEGQPGLRHQINPSRYNCGPDLVPQPTEGRGWQPNTAFVTERFDRSGNVDLCYMIPPMAHHFRGMSRG